MAGGEEQAINSLNNSSNVAVTGSTAGVTSAPRLPLPNPARLIPENVQVHDIPIGGYSEFEEIYGTDNNQDAYSFLSFDTAYAFGKLVAKANGFRMRIK